MTYRLRTAETKDITDITDDSNAPAPSENIRPGFDCDFAFTLTFHFIFYFIVLCFVQCVYLSNCNTSAADIGSLMANYTTYKLNQMFCWDVKDLQGCLFRSPVTTLTAHDSMEAQQHDDTCLVATRPPVHSSAVKPLSLLLQRFNTHSRCSDGQAIKRSSKNVVGSRRESTANCSTKVREVK